MLERLLLYFSLFGVMWVLVWIVRLQKTNESRAHDDSPFAMREGADLLNARQKKMQKK